MKKIAWDTESAESEELGLFLCWRWWNRWWSRWRIRRSKTLCLWGSSNSGPTVTCRYLFTISTRACSNRCFKTWWIVIRARTVIVFPRPNNTSNDSYDDNDKHGDSDNDDSFSGGIKRSLFSLDNRVGSSLSLSMGFNAVSCVWVTGSNNSSYWPQCGIIIRQRWWSFFSKEVIWGVISILNHPSVL